jgi:hypothetical protein
MAHPLHLIIITSFVLCNDIIIWFLYYLLYLVALHVKLHDIRLSKTLSIMLPNPVIIEIEALRTHLSNYN